MILNDVDHFVRPDSIQNENVSLHRAADRFQDRIRILRRNVNLVLLITKRPIQCMKEKGEGKVEILTLASKLYYSYKRICAHQLYVSNTSFGLSFFLYMYKRDN